MSSNIASRIRQAREQAQMPPAELRRRLRNRDRDHERSGPTQYASFVIGKDKNGNPVVLAEEQERFSFPDKKVTYKVKG